MWAVPSMAVFCSSLIPCLPGMLLRYFLNNFDAVLFVPVITGITYAFIFHIFSISFLSTFLTPEIATSIRTHAPFPLSRIMSSLVLLSSSSYLYEHLNLIFKECELVVFDKESVLTKTVVVYYWNGVLFLDVFVKLRKATISFVMSIRPAVHVGQLGSHWTDFHEKWCLSIFRKSVEKTKFSLKSDKHNGTLHEDQYIFFIISRSVLRRMKNVSDKCCTDYRDTRLMFSDFLSKIVPFMR